MESMNHKQWCGSVGMADCKHVPNQQDMCGQCKAAYRAAQAQATATNTGMVSASKIAAILDTLESARSQPYFPAVLDESILRLRQLHHA